MVAICTDIRMSLVQTVRSLLLSDFLSADPVASICRRSQSSAVQDQAIIKAAKRIINADKMCRSYSDLNFGVTFLEHTV